MKVINTGNTYRIYDDTLKTFDQMPVRAYEVCFDMNSGFFLTGRDDVAVIEKVYGVHMDKVKKVLSSFERVERNLGVILSGDKGIGKSLFAKLIGGIGIAKGYPLIIVNNYVPGIAGYLASIQQPVIVLFDEFDKTFNAGSKSGNTLSDPQTEMLTLFDGLNTGKKLFVITCNDVYGLNDYMINRPGRFHYHFRFDYPDARGIREYLQDNIPESAYGEIERVIEFAQKVNLNYDCLRSIAFELSSGISFDEAITDLNILSMSTPTYEIKYIFEDGKIIDTTASFDLFCNESIGTYGFDKNYEFNINFNPEDCTYDVETDMFMIPGEKVDLKWDESDFKYAEEGLLQKYQDNKLKYMVLKSKGVRNYHYNLKKIK